MASVYKKRKDGPYYIAYCPRPHVRRVVAGCMDYKATQAIARKLEDEARQIRRGVIDTKSEKLANSERRPLREHLDDFVAALRGKAVTERHVMLTENYIKSVITACGFEKPADLDAAKLAAHVAELRKAGGGAAATNNHLTAIKSFSRWLFRTERMRTDPLLQVSKLNSRTDRRHVRRALTDDELARVIAAAQDGPYGYGLSGPRRAMLYRTAAETGLRAGELASLTPESFDLADLDQAAVKVVAAYSKHRRDDVVPLRRDFAQAVAAFISELAADARLFAGMRRTADMLRGDMAQARQAWLEEPRSPQEREKRAQTSFLLPKDGSGRVVDFHALRHTFITRLAQSGVTPAVARSLARHSTIALTMDHYTHTLIGDERAALDLLPTMTPPGSPKKRARKTGTYDLPVERGDAAVAPGVALKADSMRLHASTSDDQGDDADYKHGAETGTNAGNCGRVLLCSAETGRVAQSVEQRTFNA